MLDAEVHAVGSLLARDDVEAALLQFGDALWLGAVCNDRHLRHGEQRCGKVAHQHSASKTRVNALMALRPGHGFSA
jgi:hypothetical protein